MTTASRRFALVPSVFAAAGLTAAIVGAAGTVVVRYVSPAPIIGAFGFGETAMVGYVIAGRAELHVEGQMVLLEAGSSYVVPPGARHFFHVLDPLTAVEATSPPYHVHGRDKPV